MLKYIAKQTFKQGLPQDQILQLIEHHVKKTYLDSIQELKDKGFIDEGLLEQASSQSNIDNMMQQMQEEGEVQPEPQQAEQPMPQQAQPARANNLPQPTQSGGVPVNVNGKYEPPKLLKLVTVALLLKRIDDEEQVQTILEHFDQEDAGTVIKYMYVDNLEEKVDPNVTMKFLDEIAENLPQAIEVNKKRIVERVKNVAGEMGRTRMENLLQRERQKVRQFVFNAIEDEFYKGVSPKIANIIATHLEHSV